MERNILRSIILLSEKAANIARTIRKEDHLLSLLTREKKDDEKNQRFFQDFKTLADVLVQEVVKHELGTEFPELVGHIYGEESNEFSCLDGETIELKVCISEEKTAQQLLRIVGDEKVANLLACLVHSKPEFPDDLEIPTDVTCLPLEEIGIWIDPIDSTAEYINANEEISSVNGICLSGLPCVTVLIGAFLRGKSSGNPVLGVLNQPFHKYADGRWKGRVMWGIAYRETILSSVTPLSGGEKLVVLSRFEKEEVKSRLKKAGYTLLEAAGAGYKLMLVATGAVCAYVLSKPCTFYWDTCSVDTILRAHTGGLVNYHLAVTEKKICPLLYCEGVGVDQCANKGGFIAYNNSDVLHDIIGVLAD
ncbi:inositol polyphosphate 1-phosphatase-like [Macrosteles quadrilineatus]|uniref:inositol polyphosphate 1-phosphatase-like n=1 Tax=Macrosteles quadrilineatus TaxID=74068 RepID=UPI0023E0C6BB|nr:inositol polyphosphate 1-phosphatase-like [Macrosteles quadrilineatus]XP_054280738.1 inositol polyphosphate 1-phosphatase-like [Macrosteles quadrilineatus]